VHGKADHSVWKDREKIQTDRRTDRRVQKHCEIDRKAFGKTEKQMEHEDKTKEQTLTFQKASVG
jgi:hypothetical protein